MSYELAATTTRNEVDEVDEEQPHPQYQSTIQDPICESPPPSPQNATLSLFALCLCNAVDAIETLAFGSVLTGFVNPSTQERLDKEPVLSGMLTTSVFIGMLIGGAIAGGLADKFGRKLVLLCCMLINATCGMLSFFSSVFPRTVMRQVLWLFCFRLIGGLGIGGSVPCTYALVAELTVGEAEHRERRVTILGTAWTMGSIFVALSAWVILDPKDNTETWPFFFLWCSSVAWVAFFMTLRCVHEAPRTTPPPRSILNSSSNASCNDEEEMDAADKFPKLVVFYYCLVWFSQNFGSYGPLIWIGDVFTHLGHEDPYFISLVASAFQLVGNFVAFTTMDYVSHCTLLISGMLVSASAALAFGIPDAPPLFIVCSACVFTASVGLSWISLGVLSAEAFPAAVRATYFGAASSFGRLGSISANAVNPVLVARGLILPCAGLVLLAGATVVGLKLKDVK